MGISAGAYAVCGWTSDGTAYCWGDNTSGAAGAALEDSDTCSQPFPLCVLQPNAVSDPLRFTAVSAGRDYTFGITRDQRVSCWGNREELGSGRPMPSWSRFSCASTGRPTASGSGVSIRASQFSSAMATLRRSPP
ncbi:MAG: hypothetical protein LJF06_17755 [Gemmatimonadetes bacterium]|nr:hypothetical protein [Gemmatimonadota bacterium]